MQQHRHRRHRSRKRRTSSTSSSLSSLKGATLFSKTKTTEQNNSDDEDDFDAMLNPTLAKTHSKEKQNVSSIVRMALQACQFGGDVSLSRNIKTPQPPRVLEVSDIYTSEDFN